MSKWQKVKLGDICDILDSYRVPITAKNREVGIYPYYGANGIQDYVKDFIFDGDYVLVAEDGGYFGSKTKPISYKVSGKFWVNNHAHILKAKKDIFTDYLCYSTMFYDVSSLVNGATRQKLTQAALKEIKIPLPPMEEQKKIVARLDAVSDLLAKQKQLLSEQDTLIQSTFYDMFGDPLLNTNGYLLKYFDEIFSRIKNGANIKQSKLKNGLPITRIETISNYSVNRNRMGFAGINDIANYLEYELQDNDILISHINSLSHIGKSALYRKTPGEKIIHGMNLLCLRPIQSKVNPLYIKHLFKTSYFKKKILSITKPAVNQASFTVSDFKKLTFPLPPFELQQKFAAVAEQIESEKSKIKSAIAETQTLFNALMSEYFEE